MLSPDDQSIEVRLGARLRQLGMKLTLVESCTGGLMSYRVTSVPGSSEYFVGGCVAYSYEAKERLLGVEHKTLLQHGAVSRQTVLEMARGARTHLRSGTDIEKVMAAAITGIAGPGGGMPHKPVGLVWAAICGPGYEAAWQFNFAGGREAVREAAAEATLQKLLEVLDGQHT
jgi:PncC family amidohydrolase